MVEQTETSILKTLLSLSAHVSDLRLSADDFSLVEEEVFLRLPLPRYAGVRKCLEKNMLVSFRFHDNVVDIVLRPLANPRLRDELVDVHTAR